MTTAARRPGRPRSISRDMLAEAACELFLENGYDDTSVTDIASRAGIGRSSFFNYAATKAELLWGGLDERIAAAAAAVDEGAAAEDALRRAAARLAPDALALAIANASAMRIEASLEQESALRAHRAAVLAARALRRDGADPLAADVTGGAYGAALLAAIRAWALAGAGTAPLSDWLDRALAAVPAPAR
ncbi:helix-turn-helix domain-containing protein [Microbacterium halophytorum]|uniref:helix-turn-helix domain-containing protein n=1 Tax=Microbacterium halophytorum TaxID=2067568 RepID=UPI000CFDCC6E|nr:helix-turn-helix domain-containing protein [Microbacterium halophytorum]